MQQLLIVQHSLESGWGGAGSRGGGGAYLVATHVTPEHDPDTLAGAGRACQERGLTGQIRAADEFAELAFRGLEMVDPGLTLVSEWRPRGAGPRPMAWEVNA